MANAEFPPGSQLYKNYAWTSGNGQAVLRLQEDGNLVLYKDCKPAWQAKDAYPDGYRAIMHEDGNFVVYNQGDNPLWASNTDGNPGASWLSKTIAT